MSSSTDMERYSPEAWPPGTVHLENLSTSQHGQVILQPAPSDDPNDPLSWSPRRKAVNFGLVCLYTLMVFTVLDIPIVVYGPVHEELGFSFEQLNRSYAASTAGLAVGNLIFLPFAFKFGRRPVYLFSIIVLLVRSIWQARMQSSGDLYGASVVSGLAGAIAETLCNMSIADLFFIHQRGSSTNIFTITLMRVLFSPLPLLVTLPARKVGAGMTLILFVFFYEETLYIPTTSGAVDRADDSSGIKQHGVSQELETISAIVPPDSIQADIPLRSYWQRRRLYTVAPGDFRAIFRHTYEPFIILFTFPGVAYVAITYGSLLAWLAIALNVLATDFTLPPYNFSSSGIGLLNLAPFIGCIVGGLFGGQLSDYSILWLSRRNNGTFHPEMRLMLALPIVLTTPAGYFIFGLCTAKGIAWYVPAIGLGFYGFGLGSLGTIALTYLCDAYRDIVGDSLLGVIFVRNTLATLTTTWLSPWIATMGLYNMFVMSGCLSIALFLLTLPMMIWGRKCRQWTAKRYRAMAARQSDSRMI